MGALSSTSSRIRSVAHRFHAGCVLGSHEQVALALRYDEENPDEISETFVVKLRPGNAEMIDQLPGTAKALAVSAGGSVFVLDGRGVIHASGKRHRLPAPRDLAAFGDGVVVAGDDRIWFLSESGEIREGPELRARRLASNGNVFLALTDEGALVWSDGSAVKSVPVDSSLTKLAVGDDGTLLGASGSAILEGDVDGLQKTATAHFDVHAIARFKGRTFVSSKAHGLFVVEDGKVISLRPSLRAHTLHVQGGFLVAASDLFIATSDDGVEILSRDLSAFVRIAEQRAPRFFIDDPI